MKPVFMREMPRDKDGHPPVDFVNWIVDASARNLFDPKVLDYPRTQVYEAYTREKSLVYCPVQQLMLMESLAINPGNSFAETAAALKQMVLTVAWESRQRGQGEVHFLCEDKQTAEFAERHEFEKVDIPLYRLRLPK